MNTVISKVIDEDTNETIGYDMDDCLMEQVVASIVKNNAFAPNVDRVIYNTKTTDEVAKKDGDGNPVLDDKGRVVKETVKLERPVLVTVVYFKDGTKVTVKNSAKDGITLVDKKVKLSDGSEKTVATASDESKEIGLVYAIVKRVVCDYDDNGTVKNAGFARFLHNIVDNAFVQDVEEVKLAGERKILKSRPKTDKKDKGAKENRSLGAVVGALSKTVEGLKSIVENLAATKCGE